jgi:hypothetical protein
VVLGGVAERESGRLGVEFALVGGTTSPLSEFRSLAMDAGLRVTNAGPGPTDRFTVECRPV